MKAIRFIGLFFACMLAAASPSVAKSADGHLPSPVIAIVDLQRILQESLASNSVQKQLDMQRSKFQGEVEKEENSLRRAEKELSSLRSQLSAEAYSEREQQLRQRFLTVENNVQSRRKVLDRSYTEAMAAVHAALLDVVSAVAHERGANLVIVKQQALWTDQPLDITDEVLKKLDQKMPKIDLAPSPQKSEK